MLGALLALTSAACFGLNNTAIRRGVLTGGVLHAMAITVPIGVPLFALVCLAFGGFQALANLPGSGWGWMALAGLVHFVIGRYGNYRATRALGANLSGPIQQTSVPLSLVLAVVYLEELITPLRLIGFLLVMFAPMVMMRGHNKNGGTTKSGFKPRYGEGFLWGGISAVGYGSSPLFIVMGLGPGGSIRESLAGGLISYTVAAIVVLALVLMAGGSTFMKQLDRTAGKWFLLSGVFVFISQMLRYMALSLAPVSVVVPIQRLSPVFRVIFGWLINRDHEIFGFWVLFGIGMSVIGAIALSLSTEIVLDLFPSSWAPVLSLEWP